MKPKQPRRTTEDCAHNLEGWGSGESPAAIRHLYRHQVLMAAIHCFVTCLLTLLAFALLILLTSCGTVIPKPVQANVASYDGGAQNSGLICMTTNSTGEVTGAVITPHARDRYNALVTLYSTNFFPRLEIDAGITPAPPNFRIDAEHLVDFMRMNRWHKAAAPPKP